jgi:hypothetical protein
MPSCWAWLPSLLHEGSLNPKPYDREAHWHGIDDDDDDWSKVLEEEVHHRPQGHENFTIPTTIQSPIGDTSVATCHSHAKLTWPHMCEQPSKMNVY